MGYVNALSSNILTDTNKKITDILGQGEEAIKSGGNTVTETVKSTTNELEEAVKPVTGDGSEESIVTKAKRKFNDTSPAIVGAGGFVVAKFVAKLGLITSAVIGAVSYLGKQQLDKSGGLSDTFNDFDMKWDSKSPDGKNLYKNRTNGRLYYQSGYDTNGQPVWNQFN
jgi:hypothetical protein